MRKSERRGARVAIVATLALAVLPLVLATGCGPKREPVYAVPDLATSEFRNIQLMPVVDTRSDPFDAVTVANQFRSASKRVLEGKGYAVSLEPVSTPERKVSAAEIAAMDTEQLAGLAPPDHQYLMYLYIDVLERGYETRGEFSRVRVRGRIIDARDKSEIWRDAASAESALTGMLSVLSGPGTDYEALYQAARNLFRTLPDRKKG